MVATASPIVNGLAAALEQQDALIRAGEFNERTGQGGFRVLGKLIELRMEVARDANAPSRALAAKIGNVLDWKHHHNGPLLGCDPMRRQLLMLSPVPPLPDIVDPSWKPTKFIKMDFGSIPDENEVRPMIKQSFEDHASGRWTGTNFLVFRPLTQALYKLDRVIGMSLISFASNIADGTSPAFLLDVTTGKGHFLGGSFGLR
jgi:hypothetical protein